MLLIVVVIARVGTGVGAGGITGIIARIRTWVIALIIAGVIAL